jgi:hypothetical protein
MVEVPFKGFTLGLAPCLSRKQYISLGRVSRDKLSRILYPIVNCIHKSIFLTLGRGCTNVSLKLLSFCINFFANLCLTYKIKALVSLKGIHKGCLHCSEMQLITKVIV